MIGELWGLHSAAEINRRGTDQAWPGKPAKTGKIVPVSGKIPPHFAG
ncbi:hypothetical protein [Aurantiacibacter xanthus]|nr:hypothetical protein [Aurantiacibacter xanthus]